MSACGISDVTNRCNSEKEATALYVDKFSGGWIKEAKVIDQTTIIMATARSVFVDDFNSGPSLFHKL